ncbi:hypothetical protein ILUMI_14240 [Ignelater luminosus]|uniref:Uncharacterized protein n=1 Tax=Ignelater luminosus TaxID=2038154 RepID=A0A8K0CWA9_IGNLU|nr:hypothetical protein ILUMI_14240 [Ignelater luminosus]
MILIHPDDRDFHRNLWRDDSSKPIQIYRLTRVIYGTKPAVFLATRVLRKLAIEAEPNRPLASKVMNNDFYVADILTDSNSIKQAIIIRDQATNVLASGGFNLCKWASKNSQLLIQNADESSIIDLDKNGGIKVLERWKGALLQPLLKKGNSEKCDNYRGVQDSRYTNYRKVAGNYGENSWGLSGRI